MSIRAVYAGTFDPVTLGHEDIIHRAARLFPDLLVAVAENPMKNPLFSLSERVAMVQQTITHQKNIQVIGFQGLLAHFLEEREAHVIIRGLRAVSDFDFEFQMAGMNRKLMPLVETVFLTPSDQFMFLSSTIVREIALLGGDVAAFVNDNVRDCLKNILHTTEKR
jgi:pantetheine-phosphate adenylyltransferase